ncbi:MAG: hypothetical protein RL662_1339 [Bacteroidota bacterium]|jgi:5'(3')-deoxyribonucleotidase
MIKNILLDLDGVMTDFLSSALALLNARFDRTITPEEYAKHNIFDIEKVYGISSKDFWDTIETKDFWISMKPMPWAKELYEKLNKIAPVTIASSPSNNPFCAADKAIWVQKHLGLKNSNLMLGSRKYLMASTYNVLIDDYPKNIDKFREHGGHAILIPSSWNTANLTFTDVWDTITEGMKQVPHTIFKENPVQRDRHGGMVVIPNHKGKEF